VVRRDERVAQPVRRSKMPAVPGEHVRIKVRTRALVTLVVGSDYESNFEHYCRKNWTAYADRHGYDLVIYNSPLDTSRRAAARPMYWQKNLVLEQAELADYEQIAWIDSDIVINAARAPLVFDGVPVERIGVVDEYRVPDAATYRKTLAVSYLRARRLRQPFLIIQRHKITTAFAAFQNSKRSRVNALKHLLRRV
jgi:galactosyl transferase GMA12/MNN10 family